MALTIGTRLGPYEILSALGAGGMGEVYRARDTKLDREVAIKVLPELFVADPERVARFQREAKTLAALNHPHIGGIYGLEDAEGVHALVLELVEGPTLADRIAQGPIPLDEALPIARQIAEALDAAHEQGIIHRDLKPANIKVRADGTVKVLDFGLAKALEPTTSGVPVNVTASPTITSPAMMTGVGAILGTAAYMAPEQAKGRPVDKRADIWAFGCVVYEMLTGARAFAGEDITDTIVAVVSKEPDWQALLPNAAVIQPLLTRCLKKDAKARMRDIGEARLQIDDIRSGATVAQAPTLQRTVASLSRHLGFALATTAVAGAALAATVTWFATRPGTQQPIVPTRFAIEFPQANPLVLQPTDRNIAISPDGRYIAYRAGIGQTRLYVRRMDELDGHPITGISNVRGPFFSPDSRWIGFWEGGEFKKVSVVGGPPIVLCRVAGPPRGASWGDNNTIVLATGDPSTGLMSVPAGGGQPTVLTKPDESQHESDHVFPRVLPGSRGILFTIASNLGATAPQVAVLDLTRGTRRTLIRGGSSAEYVAPRTEDDSAYLVYATSGSLRAVRFDLARLEIIGDPFPVVDSLLVGTNGSANFAVSWTGTLVLVPVSSGAASMTRALVWVDRTGREVEIPVPPRAYMGVRLSPDATRIAMDIRDQDNDIWTWDIARNNLTRLTFDSAVDQNPIWTHDGRYVLFSSTREGRPPNVFRRASDGTGADERVTTSTNPQFVTTSSGDGSVLLGYEVFSVGPSLVRYTTGASTRQINGASPWSSVPLFKSETFLVVQPELSPDGRYVAYQSSESGQFEIYVRPFPNVDGGRWQVSLTGGTGPLWSRNGRELFYLNGSSTLTGVPVQTAGSTFVAGTPANVFARATRYVNPFNRSYDVSPDGKRFVMIKDASADGDKAPTVVVVEHWFEELRQKAPPR